MAMFAAAPARSLCSQASTGATMDGKENDGTSAKRARVVEGHPTLTPEATKPASELHLPETKAAEKPVPPEAVPSTGVRLVRLTAANLSLMSSENPLTTEVAGDGDGMCDSVSEVSTVWTETTLILGAWDMDSNTTRIRRRIRRYNW